MQNTKPLLLSFLLLLAASCTPRYDDSPQMAKLYDLVTSRPILCTKGADCDKKWARAVQWVREHNYSYTSDGRKVNNSIARLTKNVIQTNSAGGQSSQFRIVRYPRDDGAYGIDYSSTCEEDNLCFMRAGRQLKMDFYNTMIGVPPGITYTPPNLYRIAPGALK